MHNNYQWNKLKLLVAQTKCKGSPKLIKGTAFLIDETHALTCAHCLGTATNWAKKVKLYFGFRGKVGEEREAEVLDKPDWEHDVAILCLAVKLPSEVRPFDFALNGQKDEQWESFGYPVPLKKGGLTMGGTIKDPEAKLESKDHKLKLIQLHCDEGINSIKGASGAPVVVGKTIIGMLCNQAVVKSKSELYKPEYKPVFYTVYATPIEQIKNLLHTACPKLRIEPTSEPRSQDNFVRCIPAPHQIPAPVGDFVGHKDHINTLIDALRNQQPGFIWGMTGSGKTQLALFVANKIHNEYPDAQLFVDLRGTDPTPCKPSDVLAAFIRAFNDMGKPTTELEELRARYLSHLNNKRVLVVLDNADNIEQVTPLLPILPKGCAVLVTSRTLFALPDKQEVVMEQLQKEEACQMLKRIVSRLTPEDAGKIADLCGCLPLALRAAGSFLAETIDQEPQKYIEELRNEHTRLKSLGKASVGVSVEASYNLSYNKLQKEESRVLRQLSVFQNSFDAVAVEKICDDANHACLSKLVKYSMVLYDTNSKRYHLHDLMRNFAKNLLLGADLYSAERRHAEYYKNILEEANKSYERGGDGITKGLILSNREWINIAAGQKWAAEHVNVDDSIAKLCSEFAEVGESLLELRLSPSERLPWLKSALDSAHRLKNSLAEGRHLSNLGLAYCFLEGKGSERALLFYKEALKLHRKAYDHHGKGNTLARMGWFFYQLGKGYYKKANGYYANALDIHRDLNDPRQVAHDLNDMATIYFDQKEYAKAKERYKEALEIARKYSDWKLESETLGNLGNICYQSDDDLDSALDYYKQSAVSAHNIGYRRYEGYARDNMGIVLNKRGRTEDAIKEAERALQLLKQVDDQRAGKIQMRLEQWRKKAT